MLAGLIVLALFAPLAWLLARLAFYRVRDVTKTARSITATGELDRRCFYAGPRDDVGDLVVAVNELLTRYDLAIGRIRRLQAAPPACGCPREVGPPDPADLVLELGGALRAGQVEASPAREASVPPAPGADQGRRAHTAISQPES
jgi:hypothetical protein